MLFYMIFQMAVMFIIAVGLKMFGNNMDVEAFMNHNALLLASISNILTIILLVICYKIQGKKLRGEIRFIPVKPKQYVSPCAAAFLFSLLFSLITYGMNFENASQIEAGAEYYSAILPWLGTVIQVISLLIISPVTEEIIFRGLILTALQRRCHNTAAILLSGLFFGLIHFMAGGMVLTAGATGMGIIFGIIFVETKSLLPVILAHGIANTADFIIALLSPLTKTAQYTLTAVLALLCSFIAIQFMRKHIIKTV